MLQQRIRDCYAFELSAKTVVPDWLEQLINDGYIQFSNENNTAVMEGQEPLIEVRVQTDYGFLTTYLDQHDYLIYYQDVRSSETPRPTPALAIVSGADFLRLIQRKEIRHDSRPSKNQNFRRN